MLFSPQSYVLLADKEDATADQYSAGQDTKVSYRKRPSHAMLIGLLLSLILNTFLAIGLLYLLGKGASIGRTTYAQLATDFPTAWSVNTPYSGDDDALADRLWDEITVGDGIVALSDSYAESMGLPTSERFPMDQNKGIYVLNGFHSMHCLKVIRQAIVEFDRGLNRSESTGHILHCVDALRQDVLCYADDELRYTGSQPVGHSGTGQLRQCRSWSRLDAWAQQHTACYRYLQPHNHTMNPLERFQFCPEGSPYSEKAKELLRGL